MVKLRITMCDIRSERGSNRKLGRYAGPSRPHTSPSAPSCTTTSRGASWSPACLRCPSSSDRYGKRPQRSSSGSRGTGHLRLGQQLQDKFSGGLRHWESCRTVLNQVDQPLWCADGYPRTGLLEKGNLFLDFKVFGKLEASVSSIHLGRRTGTVVAYQLGHGAAFLLELPDGSAYYCQFSGWPQHTSTDGHSSPVPHT